MQIVIIVAVARNGVIGREGGLPWKLSSDLRRFKAETLGKPVVMGRKTYESIGRPLPDRLNVIVTRDREFRALGAETVHSLEDAITLATVRARCMTGVDEICIIGGGQIYAEALPLADRLKVTHVLADPEGDATFPPIDAEIWREAFVEDLPAGGRDSEATRYVVYDRRNPGQ